MRITLLDVPEKLPGRPRGSARRGGPAIRQLPADTDQRSFQKMIRERRDRRGQYKPKRRHLQRISYAQDIDRQP